jgi:signal transduction histidine kinase
MVYADRNMINTVIRNLLTNAIKFTPLEGTIKIQAKQLEDIVRIHIADSGIGMNKEQVDALFKIEKGQSREGTEGETGTGLGLILCKEFISKNKGKIWVKSIPQKGSTFYISLPISNKAS